MAEEGENFRKYYSWIIIGALIIGTGFAYGFKFYEDKGQLTALIDVTLTTIALIIAIMEILMLRSIADESKAAVSKALGRITEIMSVSDISRGIKTAYEIQKYLITKSYPVAHLRMQDLKFIVIPLKIDKRFTHTESAQMLPNVLNKLTLDIANLNSLISGNKNDAINIAKINDNLEELVTILIEFENHIKHS